MKTLSSLLLVLLLSIPAAWAGSVDGKGIYCPYDGGAHGFWFEDGKSFRSYIEGYEIIDFDGKPYKELGTETIEVLMGHWNPTLNRRTLKFFDDIQCYLVKTRSELHQELQKIIDAAKAENKL